MFNINNLKNYIENRITYLFGDCKITTIVNRNKFKIIETIEFHIHTTINKINIRIWTRDAGDEEILSLNCYDGSERILHLSPDDPEAPSELQGNFEIDSIVDFYKSLKRYMD